MTNGRARPLIVAGILAAATGTIFGHSHSTLPARPVAVERAAGERTTRTTQVSSSFARTVELGAAATVLQPSSSDWYMAGANPQRTSWVSEEVRGSLGVEWYRPIEPYIPYKVQPIATNGKIYVATAKGLYALNATTGDVDFVYPTAMPVGNSPTVVTVNGVLTAYFGGYDRTIRAINAHDGTPVPGFSPFQAEAGFETNPLVVNDTIYMGNRDGHFYAVDAVTGALRWKYQDTAPILYSAAYKNGVVYFASIDSHAYALDAASGALLWKSQQFGGTGFFTWWPVVYTNRGTGKDYVVFTNGENYSFQFLKLTTDSPTSETSLLFSGLGAGTTAGPESTAVGGDWASGTTSIDMAGWPGQYSIISYLEDRPNRHFVHVLDAADGQEFTFDSDGDGRPEYPPFIWSGVTHGGSKFPPIVNGIDGVYYQQTAYAGGDWISRGAVVGWKFGTEYVSRVAATTYASDEPTAYSSGGRLVYTTLCCERAASGVDVTIPYTDTAPREWSYWNYNLFAQAPDFRSMYDDGIPANYTNMDGWQVYSGRTKSKNGVYSNHMNSQSPPVPYRGRLYFLKGNALIAYSPDASRISLPLATSPATPGTSTTDTANDLRLRLELEIQKMLVAGHLKPGYEAVGILDRLGFDETAQEYSFGPVFEYFRNPADTVMTLLQALPYLRSGLQEQVKNYVQNNYGPGRTYDLTRYSHLGYGGGSNREYGLVPNDEVPLTPEMPGGSSLTYNFYAAWKYAEVFGNSKSMFDSMSGRVEAPPVDLTLFIKRPYMLNRFLAGYKGYLELQKLARYAPIAAVQSWHDSELNARIGG
jgi:outer membrane protein assembly factor BamB